MAKNTHRDRKREREKGVAQRKIQVITEEKRVGWNKEERIKRKQGKRKKNGTEKEERRIGKGENLKKWLNAYINRGRKREREREIVS